MISPEKTKTSDKNLGRGVSTKIFIVSLIIAVILSSGITSAYFLTITPPSATSKPVKQLVTITRYVGGLTNDEAPFYAADVEGYFAQNGISIAPVILEGTSAAVTAVAADRTGNAFSVGSLVDIVVYESNNPTATKLVSVASLGNVNPVGVLYLKSSGISKAQDLVGKTIGTPQGSLSARMFGAFLKRQGLDGKVTLQNVGFPGLAPALFSKKVDAIVQYAAAYGGLDQQAQNIHDRMGFFFLSDYGMPPTGLGLIVQKSLADNHPQVVQAIVNATLSGVKFCIVNTALCVADFIKVNPTFQFPDSFATMQLDWNFTYGPPFNDLAKVKQLSPLQLAWRDPAQVTGVVQLAQEVFGATGNIDPNTLFTNQFAQHP
jgi:ABC-type nitrate/sulfonate/bicarbonate transport system substrate-binding protein